MADAGVHVIEDMDRAAAVLHPLRLRILGELEEPDSAAGVARRLGLSRQHVNHHLRQLEAAGLVEPVAERKRRGCVERLMRSVARSFVISPRILGALAPNPSDVDRDESDSYLVASAATVIDEVAGLSDRIDPAGRPLEAMTLRADVRLTAPGLQRMFMQDLTAAVEGVVARYHAERGEGGRQLRVLVGAYPVTPQAVTRSASRKPWSSLTRKPAARAGSPT
jgi:DNA-binding transcriptional ArsR family regulator